MYTILFVNINLFRFRTDKMNINVNEVQSENIEDK